LEKKMTTIVVLFNLLPEVTAQEYEAWAREVDIPNVRSLPGCSDFRVLKVQGLLGSDQAAPYAYSEIIEVDDMGDFGEAVATEAMQAVAAAFRQFADSPVFMVSESLD
jgi:uncharacterized protein (TIGR02118 family)